MQTILATDLNQEYITRVTRLERVLENLTGKYCQTCIDKRKQKGVGCCEPYEFYTKGVLPGFFELQLRKAGFSSGQEIVDRAYSGKTYKCGFHQEGKGCLIKGYKSPICIGYLCLDVKEKLFEKFEKKDIKTIRLFFQMMEEVRYGSLNRLGFGDKGPEKLLQSLEQCVLIGNQLVIL